ncbi:hypothetical protein GCM10009865_00560 [Aeromicrobium ponti]
MNAPIKAVKKVIIKFFFTKKPSFISVIAKHSFTIYKHSKNYKFYTERFIHTYYQEGFF